MGRGKSARSLELVDAAHASLELTGPNTVRGVCYRLFVDGVIASMGSRDTRPVYKQVLWARENDIIPWEWVVDETRRPEYAGTWADPERFAQAMQRSFRRDRWEHQPVRVELWSEKGTVRGVLGETLRNYGVTFRVFHGFTSATVVRDIATEWRDKPLVALYVGDYDPSGLHMSEVDLPERIDRYGDGGSNLELRRVALLVDDHDLPSFGVHSKRTDPRYRWYLEHGHPNRAWELDAMDPRDLRARVEQAILEHVDAEAWERTGLAEQAEQESLRLVLGRWKSKEVPLPEYSEGAP